MKLILTTILFALIFNSNAQIIFNKKTANNTCISLLKKYKLKSIGFFSHESYNLESGEFNLFLAQDKKTKKWGVMTTKDEWNNSEHEYIVKPKYDSIGDLSNNNSLVILKKDDKYGIINLNWKRSKTKPIIRFNEVIIKMMRVKNMHL